MLGITNDHPRLSSGSFSLIPTIRTAFSTTRRPTARKQRRIVVIRNEPVNELVESSEHSASRRTGSKFQFSYEIWRTRVGEIPPKPLFTNAFRSVALRRFSSRMDYFLWFGFLCLCSTQFCFDIYFYRFCEKLPWFDDPVFMWLVFVWNLDLLLIWYN